MEIVISLIVLGYVGWCLYTSKAPWYEKVLTLNLISAIISVPLLGYMVLFGASGSNFYLAGQGLILYVVFSIVARKKFKFWPGILVGIALIWLGLYRDNLFWKNQNSNMCVELRADPYCVESEHGFNCVEPSKSGNMSTSNQVCPPLTASEIDEMNEKKRASIPPSAAGLPAQPMPNNEKVSLAISVYEKILHVIIESPDSSVLNYEKELAAIYNCINSEYQNSLKAENVTSVSLNRIAQSEISRSRYRSYLQSKGRIVNSSIFIPALPAGDPSLNCEKIGKAR